MHEVLARYCYRKSSVCPSVTLRYRGHIGWNSSKVIARIIMLGTSLLEPQHRQSSPKETPPKYGWKWNRGGVALLSKKPAISLKRGKIGPWLLLMTNRKSHTRFRLVPKSTSFPWMILKGHYAHCFKTCLSEPTTKKLNEDRPILSATKM